MSPHLLKSLLLPLLILLGVNLLAFVWRAIPQDSDENTPDSSWQAIDAPAISPDVRGSLLAGGHWGQPVASASGQDEGQGAINNEADTPEATVKVLNKHIQRQLQGIVRRGDWVLLFAQTGAGEGEGGSASEASPLPLPLELRSGDLLPDTPWYVGQIWADRIQLLQEGHDPLIVPLYPIAEAVTEP